MICARPESLKQTQSQPSITALICTRGRADQITLAVGSILEGNSPISELIVVDQSTDSETERALQVFRGDPRFSYIRTNTVGKGHALNIGLRAARTDLVAITDDDCEVGAAWPTFHLQALAKNPHAAISYGNVVAPDYDRKAGWIPDHYVSKDRLYTSIWQKRHARGIGANMAVRREAILAIGGFDNEVGPGGTFHACIDGDITYRALVAGYHVCEVSDSAVIHYGFRDREQARDLVRRSFYGIGAAHIKPVKCGRWSAIPVLLYEFLVRALLPALWRTITFSRPTGWGRVTSFLRGVVDGWRTPLDRDTLMYRREDHKAPNVSAPELLAIQERAAPSNDILFVFTGLYLAQTLAEAALRSEAPPLAMNAVEAMMSLPLNI